MFVLSRLPPADFVEICTNTGSLDVDRYLCAKNSGQLHPRICLSRAIDNHVDSLGRGGSHAHTY